MHERPHRSGPTTTYLAMSGRRIRLLQLGDGPPLVLVHGFGASADWWLPNMSALAARFTVYAVDLPGFGESDGFTSDEFAAPERFLAALFATLNLAECTLIGHSLGGYVVARFALAYPGRVKRL